MYCHFIVLDFITAIAKGPQFIRPILLATSQTIMRGRKQRIDRHYCDPPLVGVHTCQISVLQFVLGIYSLYVQKDDTGMF